MYGVIVVEQYFNYELEPINETLCVDMKSFYASVECVERGLDPLDTMLVVMSHAESSGGLVLAASPKAKKVLGISNVSRKYDIPDHPDLIIVPPRMNLYIKRNMEINNIFREYVSDEDLFIYSIDESFVRIQASKRLFGKTAYEFACLFKEQIFEKTGLYCTIGIGSNMLLGKLALDNEAKKNPDMIANWQYQDVPNTLWKIPNLTDFWGINTRTEATLWKMGIRTIDDLAHYDYFAMKARMGMIGQQLIAHAWGIDRTELKESYVPKSKSIGNSQVLMKDYIHEHEIKIVLREMVEQVATRARRKHYQTSCISLSLGYSRGEGERGFSRQLAIPPTNNSRVLYEYALLLFTKHYNGCAVRHMGVNFSKLTTDEYMQLSLFEDPEEQIADNKLDYLVDGIRHRFGYGAIVHASSIMEGGTAISRSQLVGGHAGGNDGL
ncbi:Y-family DNA polymerase [Vagococcus sp. BWB3-3]|uniref:Y-family DNA polymerase n=2 Tax=Vagococcus allomyrinae TaxID=2794353 RepID=A0A940P7P7_9ENTE|nr:Y-family DNA polymerase [Vagococcus allomyrinae]